MHIRTYELLLSKLLDIGFYFEYDKDKVILDGHTITRDFEIDGKEATGVIEVTYTSAVACISNGRKRIKVRRRNT